MNEQHRDKLWSAACAVKFAFERYENSAAEDLLSVSRLEAECERISKLVDEICPDDPTPWCHICGAARKADCHCDPAVTSGDDK